MKQDNIKKLAYQYYKKTFYAEHDKDNTPVCFEEFIDNEWSDNEIREFYIKKLKEQQNG